MIEDDHPATRKDLLILKQALQLEHAECEKKLTEDFTEKLGDVTKGLWKITYTFAGMQIAVIGLFYLISEGFLTRH